MWGIFPAWPMWTGSRRKDSAGTGRAVVTPCPTPRRLSPHHTLQPTSHNSIYSTCLVIGYHDGLAAVGQAGLLVWAVSVGRHLPWSMQRRQLAGRLH